MRIAAVQFDIAWENKNANYEKVRQLLEAAALPPGSLVALPELFATGFSMNTDSIAEPAGGSTELFLSDLARERHLFVVGGVAVHGKDGRPRNKALAFGPDGQLLALYAKMRLFSPGEEHLHYVAGRSPATFRAGDCTVASFVCYDLRFPELFRQAAATAQPELFIVIANWPDKRSHHWVRLVQARAIENQAYVLAVNRIGTDPHSVYCGRSLVADPHGEIVADAGGDETALTAEVDLASLRQYRQGLPFLRDMTVTA